MPHSPARYVPPAWLAHALRWQRGPIPWNAVLRGALGAGALLSAGVATGHPTSGVIAALGAMLAGINDRPGSRRAAVARLGLPTLAGALGMLIGAALAPAAVPVLLTALTTLALTAGAISSAGPVASAAGTQLTIASLVGAGMPLPEPPAHRSLLFLAGGAWLLALRLTLPSRGPAPARSAPAPTGPRPGPTRRITAAWRRLALGTALGDGPGNPARWTSPGASGGVPLPVRRLLPSRRSAGPDRAGPAGPPARGAAPDSGRRLDFLDGERDAVAAAYDAVADLLLAAGGPQALTRRARLTAALDRAQDALAGPRLRRHASSAAERRLHARFAAVLPLAEAATALVWAGEPVGERAAQGPRRLAEAVRTGAVAGPLPAPVRDTPGLRALDDALLKAAEAFGGDPCAAGGLPGRRGPALRAALRRITGPAGREYGIRVAVSTGTSAAVALALHPGHWYWLPATAVFLVKPDLGPLASRVINRAIGTVVGAVLFAALATVLPGALWPLPLAVLCAALIPVATRHFALQTGVVTLLVLSFVTVGGETGAYWNRATDTLLACVIVLVVGHMPLPVRGGGDVSARLSEAVAATEQYIRHVLERPADTDHRFVLRRAAYRTLADARSAAELAAAELPSRARHSAGATGRVAALEHLVDTATATAVQLDHHPGADTAAAREQLRRLAAARGAKAPADR